MSAVATRRATHLYVDTTPDGEVALTIVNDELTSAVVWVSPVNAARLGHLLISVAAEVESPT